MRAVILAGGVGARLRPYTTVLPKPLMPVGNYPIAEMIVRQLRHYGVTEITFAVGYLHQLIEAYFGDGSRWGVSIKYLVEDQPLGTAGPLAHLDGFDAPLIVLNGDILTDLDFAHFYAVHLDSDSDITIASYTKKVNIDLGVMKTDAANVLVDYIEKPQYSFLVSMGIYVFSPSVLRFIPRDERFDFPDLVKCLIANHRPVKAFPFDGIWLDIGRSEDYLSAAEVFEKHESRLLPDKEQAR
jgi:NDP-sugar pyrophosphorylase family protein